MDQSSSLSEHSITVSSSPIKDNDGIWIAELDLYNHDKKVLESSAWLNDGIIYAAQTKGKIYGWQSTQCAKNRSFKQVSTFQPFIQVLHVANCHWVVASNADPKRIGGYHTKAVGYCDSSHPLNVSVKMREIIICLFFKCEASSIHFDIVNVMEQTNTHDCGVLL